MDLVIVAGFYPSVEEILRNRFNAYFDNRSIIWVPQIGNNREADAGRFKWAFFDRLAVGVRRVTVLLVVFRGREYIKETLFAVAREGHLRFADIEIQFFDFEDARSHEPLINKIESLGLPVPRVAAAVEYDLKKLEKWARDELDQKILIHPRALKGARKSLYSDPSLIFESLLVLGNEYRDVRISGNEGVAGVRLEEKLNELDIHITEAMTEVAAGQFGDEYYVFYPPGQLRTKEFLSHHVKKGVDRDEQTCLRIYFFWDAKKKIVVVGWLPRHLETEKS